MPDSQSSERGDNCALNVPITAITGLLPSEINTNLFVIWAAIVAKMGPNYISKNDLYIKCISGIKSIKLDLNI